MRSIRPYLAHGLTLFLSVAYAFAQPAPAPQPKIGAVKAVEDNVVTLVTDPPTSQTISIAVADGAIVQRLAAGSTDLKTATPSHLSDITVGDRVLAVVKAGDVPGKFTATRIILMKSSDVAASQVDRQADWRRRGVSGWVQSVDAASNSVWISVTPTGTAATRIQLSAQTEQRRYASNSGSYSDSRPAAFSEIHIGDIFGARGDKSADGSTLQADEIISGPPSLSVPSAPTQPASAYNLSASPSIGGPTRGFETETPAHTGTAPSAIPIPHNYALIFATDDYTHWPHLTNPIFDADAVNQTLSSLYNFQVEEIRNPTDDQILAKLTEYLHRHFEPQDQLLIMFSGHGYFDPDLGKGFLVPANALLVKDDIGHRTLLAHETIMGYVNRIPATHVVLVLDACFAGTLDRRIADSGLRGNVEDVYAHATLPELLERKEPKRTRRYITSGGKDFVPDGLPGHHSPFISALLVTLNQAADRKGYVTLDDIQQGLNTVNPEPRWGDIQDDNDPGADFLLLTPDAVAQLTKPN